MTTEVKTDEQSKRAKLNPLGSRSTNPIVLEAVPNFYKLNSTWLYHSHFNQPDDPLYGTPDSCIYFYIKLDKKDRWFDCYYSYLKDDGVKMSHQCLTPKDNIEIQHVQKENCYCSDDSDQYKYWGIKSLQLQKRKNHDVASIYFYLRVTKLPVSTQHQVEVQPCYQYYVESCSNCMMMKEARCSIKYKYSVGDKFQLLVPDERSSL